MKRVRTSCIKANSEDLFEEEKREREKKVKRVRKSEEEWGLI